jgi:hypothetical protein
MKNHCLANGIKDLNKVGCRYYCSDCPLNKENHIEYAWCETCEDFYHEVEHL